MTGLWSVVSGCEIATGMVLLSVVYDDGKPRTAPSGGPELRFMMLPASQCEIIATLGPSAGCAALVVMRVMQSTGRVLFGLESDTPLL